MWRGKIYEGGTATRMTRPHPPDKNGLNVAKALLVSQQVPEVFQRLCRLSGLDSPGSPVGSFAYVVSRGVCHCVVHRPAHR
ncbi:hypothetical protein NSPZN2_10781 [Nitrospira defluvii]|uniref:Uncharacterized protein n=1 Tax=Nitrospira defluvii TaxID=330214 RepID=A0ABM8QK90_9BACT|nr:hypothetical protein NSPZN2_10781 [Nitrospira defluvii]